MYVLVLLEAGCVGKTLLTHTAYHTLAFGVHFHVALEVGGQAEGLATLRTALALHLGVDLQTEQVRERLETQGAVVEVF